jgi:hypothetical protein
MKNPIKLAACATLAALGALPAAHADASSYNITAVWYEPETQPNNSIFVGTLDYDSTTHTITNLQGQLSESMTGGGTGYPDDTMTWLNLDNQLVSWYDASAGGTFAAVFKNTNTNTFYNPSTGATDFWSPQVGVDNGGVYYGFPKSAKNPGNAYALIFVPDDPTAALTQAQIDLIAYADCSAGGMMGATCMTGTSVAGYGATGTMDGYPVSETIAAVPEPETYASMLVGLACLGLVGMRRRA